MAREEDLNYAERIARRFYETDAEAFGAEPWEELPEKRREGFVKSVRLLIEARVIRPVLDVPEGHPDDIKGAPAERDLMQELLDQHATRPSGRRRGDPVRTIVLLTITASNKVAAVDQRTVPSDEPEPE